MQQRRPTPERIDAARLLDCDPWAGPEQVAAAHRSFVRRHHPDHGGDGADLSRAAEARDLLIRAAPTDPTTDRGTHNTTRTRTFHRRPPWWRRLILWRIT